MYSKIHDYIILLSFAPLVIFFALSDYALMELYLKITFTFFFIYYLLFKNAFYTLSFVMVSLPFHALLKGGYFFYYIIPVIMFLLLIKLLGSKANLVIFRNKTFKLFFYGSIIYYIVSFLISGGIYTSNLKSLEFAFSLFIIPILYQNKFLFKRSILYFGIFSILLTFIFTATSSRSQLSFEFSDVASISGLNPIVFGISLLVFIILFFNENFLLKKSKGFFNFEKFILILSFIFIFLTTSRTAILAIFLCILIYYLRKNILKIFKPIILLTIILSISHNSLYKSFSSYSESYDFIIGRSLDENIDFNQYSHDRVEMYTLIFNEIKKGNFIFNGILPGNDTSKVYRKLSKKNHVLHSLYLKLITEIGLFFTLIFIISLFSLFIKSIKRDSFYQYSALLAWIVITLVTVGLDMLSALVLSIYFIQINNRYETSNNNSILSTS